MKCECITNAWFASGLFSLLGHFYGSFSQGLTLKYSTTSSPKWVIVLKNESIRGQAWQRQREVVEVPRDPMAVLQASWGPMSHFNRMRLYQLPSRFSSLATMNWWLGNAFCVSVILQPHPPSHPMVHLPLLTASTGGTPKQPTLVRVHEVHQAKCIFNHL